MRRSEKAQLRFGSSGWRGWPGREPGVIAHHHIAKGERTRDPVLVFGIAGRALEPEPACPAAAALAQIELVGNLHAVGVALERVARGPWRSHADIGLEKMLVGPTVEVTLVDVDHDVAGRSGRVAKHGAAIPLRVFAEPADLRRE